MTTITKFLNTEVKEFSVYSNLRTIPSLVDGFKPGQRKIIYTMLRRGNLDTEVKVASLGGEVVTHAAYHHGQGSLESTIVNLAQDFPGTNNYNLLEPIGQFGNRLIKESAASRYIFTKFSKYFRLFYNKNDEIILKQREEDGDLIEPEHYYPIVPMVLLNGAQGMGTGFATNILQYSANDIIDSCIAVLTEKKQKPLVPWFKGYKGIVQRNEDGQVIVYGKIEKTGAFELRITEIPHDYDIVSYKAVLNKLEESGVIKDYEDLSSGNTFEFKIKAPRDVVDLSNDKLLEKFKLISKFSENLTLWNENGKLLSFDNVEQIVKYFINIRVKKYEERIAALINLKNQERVWLENKIRFIKYWIKNSNSLTKMNKVDLISLLENEQFLEIDKLLSIKIYNLTKDEVEKLEAEIIELLKEIKELQNTKPVTLYISELETLKTDIKKLDK